MFLMVDAARATVSLGDRDDFESLKVVADGAASHEAVVELLGAGARADGDDVWLPAATIATLAAPADEQWLASYRAMLSAVARFGWYDAAADAVKLHVERR